MRKRGPKTFWALLLLCLFFCKHTANAQNDPFQFSSVTIGGGGYITGIFQHPTDASLLYARTDVGGCYRFDHQQQEWIQLMNGLTVEQVAYNNVDAIALAKTNPDLIFIAVGNAIDAVDPNDILKSTDQGGHWTPLNFPVEKAFESNQRDVRYIGERLAVDPQHEDIIFAGTKEAGLWISRDGGASWQQNADIPHGTKNSASSAKIVGVRNIVFDESTTTTIDGKTVSGTIYVGAYEEGVYKSTDGGQTFEKMPNSPETPRRLFLNASQELWVSTGYPIGSNPQQQGGGRVYHYQNNEWVDKSPNTNMASRPYGAIAISADDDNKIIVAEGKNRSNQAMYRTNNANDAEPLWEKFNPTPSSDKKIQPQWWKDHFFATGPSSIFFDITDDNQIWMADGFGIWHTENVWDNNKEIIWEAKVKGVEELVMMTTLTPPAPNAVSLFSGAADADGFAHHDLNDFPTQPLQPSDWASTALDYVASTPEHMMRLLTSKTSGGEIYWSENSGETWTKTTANPIVSPMTLGKAAVSAQSLDNMVIVPAYNAWEIEPQTVPLYFTQDRGASWQETNISFNPGPIDNWWVHDHIIVADKVQPNTFYFFYKRKSTLYRSTDGGANFEAIYQFPNHENIWGKPNKYWAQWVHLVSVDEKARELWISLPQDGLFRSLDGGDTWTKMGGLSNPKSVAVGKPQNEGDPMVIYTIASVDGDQGLFMSLDDGQQWRRCDDNEYNFGMILNHMSASRQTFGEVFIATGGRGIVRANVGANLPPVVTFKPVGKIEYSFPEEGNDHKVRFDASNSENPNGGQVTFHWDFGDGTTSNGAVVDHTYTDYGNYTAELTITDRLGLEHVSSTEILINAKPTISWLSPADSTEFPLGSTVTLSVAVADNNGAEDIDRVIFWSGNWQWLHTDRDGPDYTYEVDLSLGKNTFIAEVYDKAGSKTATEVLTLFSGSVSEGDYVIGLNCGGGNYQDAAGNLFLSDDLFTGGSTYSVSTDIAGTDDDVLYQTERVGENFSYQIPVENGMYKLTFKLAELGWQEAGKRIFNVDVEGNRALSDLDLFAVAGYQTAYDVDEIVTVTDGTLDIAVTGVERSGKINAILVQTVEAEETLPVPQNLTANQDLTTVNLQWSSLDDASLNFNIYKKVGVDGTPVLENGVPVAGNNWSGEITQGQDYTYFVKAVNSEGQESEASEGVQVYGTLQEFSVRPFGDTYIDLQKADQNFASEKELRVQYKPADQYPDPAERVALLQFDLSDFEQVVAVDFQIKTKVQKVGVHQLSLIEYTFDPATVTWNNFNEGTSDGLAVFDMPTDGAWATVSIPQEKVSTQMAFKVSAITATSGYGQYWSNDGNASNAPNLKVVGKCSNCRVLNAPVKQSTGTVFPNPFTNQLQVNWKGDLTETILQYKIFSLTGRLMLEGESKQSNFKINTASLAGGQLYFIQLSDGANQQMTKMIKR
ncbi:malectin domain-containing carbohydrate-binding protein [Persicobacter psychrovividus]|uniref:PKD domain-containing protein n=1 Tax=Persicobacter psychrovividus TaxID=387638 RepID=A0ABM7VLX1_9BACT|nr:hypothetical protein PEPS_42700 [Persicobacter psychrovividus]